MDYVMGDGAGNVFLLNGNLVASPVAEISTNFDGSLLSIVGEEANYTGDVTTDSWVNTQPAGVPSDTYCDELGYLGNDVLIAGLRTANNNGTFLTPYISRNAGVTWETLPAGQGHVGSYVVAMGPGKAVSTNPDNNGISYTEDYGETWVTKCATKPGGQTGFYICYAGQNDSGEDVLVAGTYPNGKIFYSTDNAATWTESTYTSGVTQITFLRGCGNGVVIAWQNNKKIIRSADYGQTWTEVFSYAAYPDNYVGGISILNNNRIMVSTCYYSASMAGHRYYSDDAGLTWTTIADTHTIEFMPLGNNQVLFLKHICENQTNNNPTLDYAFSSDNGLTVGSYTSTGYRSAGKTIAAQYVGNGRTVLATTMTTTAYFGWTHEYFNSFTLGTF